MRVFVQTYIVLKSRFWDISRAITPPIRTPSILNCPCHVDTRSGTLLAMSFPLVPGLGSSNSTLHSTLPMADPDKTSAENVKRISLPDEASTVVTAVSSDPERFHSKWPDVHISKVNDIIFFDKLPQQTKHINDHFNKGVRHCAT